MNLYKTNTCSGNSTTRRRECLAVITNPNMYLASADDVRLGRQQVDDFAFALVSPLRTEHHRHLVPRVITWSLLPGRGGLISVFVVFRRPAERHDGGGSRLSVSRGLNCLQQWHCHICNIIFLWCQSKTHTSEVRRRAFFLGGGLSCLQGCWSPRWETSIYQHVSHPHLPPLCEEKQKQLNVKFTFIKIYLTIKVTIHHMPSLQLLLDTIWLIVKEIKTFFHLVPFFKEIN